MTRVGSTILCLGLLALLGSCSDDGDGSSCAAGLTDCGGRCVDLQSDDINCGSCGLACGDSTCRDGMCDGSCPSGAVGCGTRCCPDPPGCDPTGAGCAMDPPPDAGGTDAAVGPRCPADPPADAAACTEDGLRCVWQRCASDGLVTAVCTGGAWAVTTATCEMHGCSMDGGDAPCATDEVCVQRIGGAFLLECSANPCGTMAIERSCACSICGGPANCTVMDQTVTCDTCPMGGCP